MIISSDLVNLLNLEIHARFTEAEVEACNATLRRLESLQKVDLYVRQGFGGRIDTSSTLSVLSQVTSLKEVSLQLGSGWSWSKSNAHPFSGLGQLTFRSFPRGWAHLLRDMAPHSQLSRLTGFLPGEELEDHLEAASHHSQLEHLDFETLEDMFTKTGLHHHSFSCLRSLAHLRVLTLRTDRPLPLADSDVPELLSGLGSLEKLKISASSTQLTLQALVHVIECCPDIHTISLKIDSTKGLDSVIRRPARNLRSMDFQGGPIDRKAVDAFLSALSLVKLTLKFQAL